jgi:hypothetical protein
MAINAPAAGKAKSLLDWQNEGAREAIANTEG